MKHASDSPRAADDPASARINPANSPLPPQRKGFGCWSVTFVTVAGATLFFPGVHAVWRWSNARALDRMIEIAQEKGEPTTWEELAGSYPTSPEIERTTELWLQAAEAANPTFVDRDVRDVAILGAASPNDPDSLKAMQRHLETGIMAPRVLKASKAYLAKTGDAVELAHAARQSGTQARFRLESETSEQDYIASLQGRRRLAQTLALDLEVRRAEGRTEGIGEVLLSLTSLAEADRESPDVLAQSWRFEILRIAREPLVASLERDELSDADLQSLQLAWEEIDLASTVRKMTLHMQVDAFQALPNDSPAYIEHDLRPCPEEDAFQAAKAIRAILDRSEDFEAVEKALAEQDAEWMRASGGPFAEQRFEGWKNMLLSLTLLIELVRTHQCFVDSVVATLACERFRRDRGEWPESLDRLVPEYLEKVPPDRWDGGTLKYASSADGLRVYSVGADGADDGGEIHDNHLATPADYGVRLSRSPVVKSP